MKVKKKQEREGRVTSARARTARHDEVARKEAYEARPRSHARPGAHGGRHINERSGGVGHARAVGRVGNYTRAVGRWWETMR